VQGSHHAHLDPDSADEVHRLISDFLSKQQFSSTELPHHLSTSDHKVPLAVVMGEKTPAAKAVVLDNEDIP
jgi:hypothetical protein